MDRKKELLKLIDGNEILRPLVNEMIYLEEQLEILRALPKIKLHPSDPSKQKATPAAKQYKEMLQQYTNVVKMFLKATGTDVEDEESPLRKWFNANSR